MTHSFVFFYFITNYRYRNMCMSSITNPFENLSKTQQFLLKCITAVINSFIKRTFKHLKHDFFLLIVKAYQCI